MSDDALYQRQVIEHLLFNLARSRIFEDVSAGKPWNVDLGTSFLVHRRRDALQHSSV